MDRVVIKCARCGRLVAANPKHGSRKCAVCGALNRIEATTVQGETDWKEAREFIAASFPDETRFHVEGTRVVKRRPRRRDPVS